MPLYTEEQLSMILSAHAAGQLKWHGATDFGLVWCDGRGCINQVAFNEPDPGVAAFLAIDAAIWFDDCYQSDMPAARLLRKLESF